MGKDAAALLDTIDNDINVSFEFADALSLLRILRRVSKNMKFPMCRPPPSIHHHQPRHEAI